MYGKRIADCDLSGRRTATNGFNTAGGLRITGTFPMIIAYVKTGSSRLRGQFIHKCDAIGIEAKEIQSWDYLIAYELRGSAEAMEEISQHAAVKEWHFPLAVRIPVGSAGSANGDADERAKRLAVQARRERHSHPTTSRDEETPTVRGRNTW